MINPKVNRDKSTGVYYIMVEGMPIDHADDHWQAVSWVVNGQAERDYDIHADRWVMFPTEEIANLAAWAMREHSKFIDKLYARSIPTPGLEYV